MTRIGSKVSNQTEMKLTISIIVPAKNEEHRLPRCLSAINNLDCSSCDIEIIVIDNGSNDNTVEIAKKYGAKTYIRKTGTISGLRNYGAKVSNGEILVFVDADVEIKPDFLKNALKYLKNPKIGIISGPIQIPEDSTWVEKTWCLNRTRSTSLQEVHWVSSMRMIVRREVFSLVGGFSEDMITCEDIVFCKEIKKHGYLIYYDPQIKAIHFGEAKNLISLFKKERWRGIDSVSLIKKYPMDYRRLISFLQFPYFIVSFVVSISCFVFSCYYIGLFAFLCTISLPFLRSLIISKKNKTLKYFHKIFIVWFVYYCARSVPILGVIRDIISKSKRPVR